MSINTNSKEFKMALQAVKSEFKGIDPKVAETLLIARLENEALKAQKAASAPKVGFKVSEKGAVSVYGVGRFPVTLYKSQWERVLERAEDLKKFMTENEGQLKTKE